MLARTDLLSLEQYAEHRESFRQQVLEHKKNRKLPFGDHILLVFEDRMTIQYQIQEMLRVERVFEPAAIQEELDAYNPLIPDGDNFKGTLFIQYPDENERRIRLQELRGVEDQVWLQVGDHDRCMPIADEDIERENDDKTSSVHFLRYQMSGEEISALKQGAGLTAGVSHAAYPVDGVTVPTAILGALVADLH
tara:strand:+ start:3819 stop:4397 length:579 start_codon:yes stop_codon:yes gene_type:complete